MDLQKKEFIVAITGASGSLYALKLIAVLQESTIVSKIHLIISNAAHYILRTEAEQAWISFQNETKSSNKIFQYSPNDFAASIASGNSSADAMIVVPCSMKTIGALSAGYTSNLILRAADVMLKENKKLILVPRETPLNLIHLRNMLILKKAGAIILPAMPAFYFKPEKIDDLIEFIVAKILKQLLISHAIQKNWNPPPEHIK